MRAGLWTRPALATLALGAGAAAAGTSVPLRFDQVFATAGEPPAIHYRAIYIARGAEHTLDVWRDGDRRLVRRTDDAVETHVARRPGEAQYQMVVLDLRKKIETRVTRDDLYRIGRFTDWFDLAHGLRYPRGDYRLTALPRAETPALATTSPCRWYRLDEGAQSTRICWNTQARLPIAIVDAQERTVWQVRTVARAPVPPEVFAVRDQEYVRNDASRDISGD